MIASQPGTWPSATLSLSALQGFNRVVVHYDAQPVGGENWGPVFMADNMNVTPLPPILGDFNGDRLVTPADIPEMLTALTDLNVFQTNRFLSDAELLAIGDLDASGAITNADIQPLLDYVASHQAGVGAEVSVPEPDAWIPWAVGSFVVVIVAFQRRSAVARLPWGCGCLVAVVTMFSDSDFAGASILLKDSFGFSPITAQGGTRFDAAGNVVGVVLHSDLSGLRAEFPNTSNEVWKAPGGHGTETWGFSVSSPDPYEKYGGTSEPTPGDNGTMSLISFPSAGTDALLDFTPPASPYQMSLDVIGGGVTTAIGFTSSVTTLNDNFSSFGQIWMVLHGGSGQGGAGTWELHTNGLTGPSVSGTTPLQGYNPMVLSYDPASHTVRGSVNGVLTPAINYTASGILGVGFEGVWTVNNFIVQTGGLPRMGDFNFDQRVDADDIPAMLTALVDLNAFKSSHAISEADLVTLADLDNSGAVTNADIQPLLDSVIAQGSGAIAIGNVPEPNGTILLALGLCIAFIALSMRGISPPRAPGLG